MYTHSSIHHSLSQTSLEDWRITIVICTIPLLLSMICYTLGSFRWVGSFTMSTLTGHTTSYTLGSSRWVGSFN